MTRLDGNVLAGRLADLFGRDATDLDARCASCGGHGRIARAIVFLTAMGTVARCPTCDAVLAVIVDGDEGRSWFGMPGVSVVDTGGRPSDE